MLATAALAMLLSGSAFGYDIPVRFGGEPRVVTSVPHKPWIVINSPAELLAKLDQIRSVIPRKPFRMGGEWIVPCGSAVRVVPDKPNRVFNFSPNGQYVLTYDSGDHLQDKRFALELATTTGELLWQHEEGPLYPVVGDDGTVAGQAGHEPTIIMYGRDGKERVRLPNLIAKWPGAPGFRLHFCEGLNLLVVHASVDAFAFATDGTMKWHRTGDIHRSRFSEINTDPLGRGLYIVTVGDEGTTDAEIVEAMTGETLRWLWRGKRNIRRSWDYFSENGRMLVLASQDSYSLFDWETGETLLTRSVPPRSPKGGGLPAASDSPPLFVQWSESDGTQIYRADNTCLWQCQTSLPRVRHVISGDGKLLSIIADAEVDRVLGLLVYRIGE